MATAHGTKGLEFDHVAVIGLDEGRFPSARSVAEAVETARALEEERAEARPPDQRHSVTVRAASGNGW